jgi:hypothetical protein
MRGRFFIAAAFSSSSASSGCRHPERSEVSGPMHCCTWNSQRFLDSISTKLPDGNTCNKARSPGSAQRYPGLRVHDEIFTQQSGQVEHYLAQAV